MFLSNVLLLIDIHGMPEASNRPLPQRVTAFNPFCPHPTLWICWTNITCLILSCACAIHDFLFFFFSSVSRSIQINKQNGLPSLVIRTHVLACARAFLDFTDASPSIHLKFLIGQSHVQPKTIRISSLRAPHPRFFTMCMWVRTRVCIYAVNGAMKKLTWKLKSW